MPLPLLLLAAGAIAGYFLMSQLYQVEGYVDGTLIRFNVVYVGNGARLRVEAARAFWNMQTQAMAEGLDLQPSGKRAGFRTPQEQQSLIDEEGRFGQGGFAAAVNKSPHQGGFALDLKGQNAAAPDYNPGLYSWLRANAPSYGWQPKGDTFSTREPWHFEWVPGTGSYA